MVNKSRNWKLSQLKGQKRKELVYISSSDGKRKPYLYLAQRDGIVFLRQWQKTRVSIL